MVIWVYTCIRMCIVMWCACVDVNARMNGDADVDMHMDVGKCNSITGL